MTETVARSIGRYQLLDIIGQGGMGVVYRGVDTSIDRTVAIKMLYGSYAEDKDLLARFHREARSTANLQHKNIVTVFALDDFQGSPYMVMEFLEGQSIADMIKDRKPLRVVDKIGLVGQVCEGLQYAHERNIIHRDIKPANVLVLKEGTAKIVDFGIARAGMSETLTQTGQVIGSMHYMSPEQISGGSLDARSDIYSAGVLLFQFLTGELPFKEGETDAQSIFVRILHEPLPSLTNYAGTFPPELDEILAKATAKSVETRYQTAEDMGYDLARLQETLQRGMTAEFLAEARAALARGDWEAARQQAQEVLRFERRHADATALLAQARAEIQKQQRSVQIEYLRSQAQSALASERYEEAGECAQQARRLDPNDAELGQFAQSILNRVERAKALAEAVREGHAALYTGDLGEAETSVRKALALDPENTGALALGGLVEKELAERRKRTMYQGLLEEARRNIAERDFLAALHPLRRAQEIDPTDSNIQELLNWASRGHEQEKQRRELQDTTSAIGQMLSKDMVEEALQAAEAGLVRFPGDASLGKLQQLAKRQSETLARRRAADQACAEARQLVEANRSEDAIAVLTRAIREFPGDPNLETILAITRADLDRVQQERRAHADDHCGQPVEAGSEERRRSLELLQQLQEGLTHKQPILQLCTTAERLQGVGCRSLEADELTRYHAALAEVKVRLERRELDRAELAALLGNLQAATSSGAIEPIVSEARLLAEQHSRDEEIQAQYAQIRRLADEFRMQRQTVSREISDGLGAMQAEANVAAVEAMAERIAQAAAFWSQDDFIRSMVAQAAEYVGEVKRRKAQALEQLARIHEALPAARSAGQIRLLEEQTTMVSMDVADAEVGAAVAEVRAVAAARLQRLEEVSAEMRELMAKVIAAPAIAGVDAFTTQAHQIASRESHTEEVEDLLRRIERSVDERKRDHRRIATNLDRLIESAAKATGPAELDLMLAQSRDLLRQHEADPELKALEGRLEGAIAVQRGALARAAEDVPVAETESSATVVESAPVRPAVPVAVVAAEPAPQKKGKGALYGLAAAAVLLVVAGGGAWLATGSTVTVVATPADAAIAVDGTACAAAPCTVKLKPGTHEVRSTRAGLQDATRTIQVPWFGAGPGTVQMAMLPVGPGTPVAPGNVTASGTAAAAAPAKLTVDTRQPGVSVYLNGRFEGQTAGNGRLTVETTAGMQEIRVEKQGFKTPAARTVQASATRTLPVPFALEPGVASPIVATSVPVPAAGKTVVPAPAVAVPAEATQPPRVKLQLSSTSVIAGQAVTLSWHTENAREVAIEGIGPVDANGSRAIVPTASTTYTLMARGPAGSAAESVRIEVAPVPKAVAAAAPAPAPLAAGGGNSPDAEREGVRQSLRRYKEAYESESLDEVKRIWPTVSKDQQKGLKEAFKFNAIRLDLGYGDDDIHLAGDEATVNCKQTFSYTLNGKKLPGPSSATRIMLRRQGHSWTIASVGDR